MVVRVAVRRELLEWARERARLDAAALANRFPKLAEWEAEEAKPTLKQLEAYARATHTPVGYLLLDEPPDESLPIPDFRTMRDERLARPSADLLDTIYQAQLRQAWYRSYQEANGAEPLDYVGSLSIDSPTRASAADIRGAIGFDVTERGSTWTAALTTLIERAETLGLLVMVNGVVGSNTHRRLDAEEFRGFSLVDGLAPVIFINGADTKAAQIFTLAHELAHVWLGQAGLDDVEPTGTAASGEIEAWCNRVAAELLIPADELERVVERNKNLAPQFEQLASHFKVSTLTVLRRLRDEGYITPGTFAEMYRDELQRIIELMGERGGGGNFYNTLPVRVSKRFARALIANTLEGQTFYRDALQLLGFRKLATFEELSEKLGVA